MFMVGNKQHGKHNLKVNVAGAERERLSLPRSYTQRLLRAIREFDLIRPGDRVLVGFSGGKDSAFLLYALAVFAKHQLIPFTVGALSIDLGYELAIDAAALNGYCQRLEVPLEIMKTEIARHAFAKDSPEPPCAICSYLRRGAMNRYAVANGYNVVALAHHQDDAVETFLMNIIYSGQLKTFLPRTELSRSGLTVIRPLAYFREAEIKEGIGLTGFTPVKNPCPIDGYTKREETKQLIRQLARSDPKIFSHLTAAMREGRAPELWPPPIGGRLS